MSAGWSAGTRSFSVRSPSAPSRRRRLRSCPSKRAVIRGFCPSRSSFCQTLRLEIMQSCGKKAETVPVGQTVYVISCHMPNITWFSFPRSMLPSAGPSGATRRSRSWPRSGIGSSKLWPPTTKSLPIRCANVLFFFSSPPSLCLSLFSSARLVG